MDILVAFLIVFSNICISARIVQGQSLLKRGDQSFTLRTEELERILARNVQQNIQLERRLENINNEWFLKFQEFQRQNESSTRKIQDLERRLAGINDSWSEKFQEFKRQSAGSCVILEINETKHLYFRYLSNMDLFIKILFSSDNRTLHILSNIIFCIA